MDRTDWKLRLQEEEWRHWAIYLKAADKLYKKMYTPWALNLLSNLCELCGCSSNTRSLPAEATRLREAIAQLCNGKSSQIQCRSIRTLRVMIVADAECAHLLDFLPRHRQQESVNRIRRQRQLVMEDCLPKRGVKPWVRTLLTSILDHDASAHWRTSKSANQNLSLTHKFLRSSGLLGVASLEEFHDKLAALDAEAYRVAF
jgi:hypothetical protein